MPPFSIPPDAFIMPTGALFDRRMNDSDLRLVAFLAWCLSTRGRLIADLQMADAMDWSVRNVRDGLIKLHATGAIQHLEMLRPDSQVDAVSNRARHRPRPGGMRGQ